MDTVQNLKSKLKETLEANRDLTEEERRFLIESMKLFNEAELRELIDNNTPKP